MKGKLVKRIFLFGMQICEMINLLASHQSPLQSYEEEMKMKKKEIKRNTSDVCLERWCLKKQLLLPYEVSTLASVLKQTAPNEPNNFAYRQKSKKCNFHNLHRMSQPTTVSKIDISIKMIVRIQKIFCILFRSLWQFCRFQSNEMIYNCWLWSW